MQLPIVPFCQNVAVRGCHKLLVKILATINQLLDKQCFIYPLISVEHRFGKIEHTVHIMGNRAQVGTLFLYGFKL